MLGGEQEESRARHREEKREEERREDEEEEQRGTQADVEERDGWRRDRERARKGAKGARGRELAESDRKKGRTATDRETSQI